MQCSCLTFALCLQVKEREGALVEAESSLIHAEERSSEAMLTAEAAVHDEMEAFTVAKEIQSAFSKALNDLNALNAVFEANTNATKSNEQAQAERDTMVRCAGQHVVVYGVLPHGQQLARHACA